jgi:hypothetical protein
MMDLHDKIAVAACHLEEGRASSIFCASALQAASALPLQRYHWARSDPAIHDVAVLLDAA